MHIKTKKSAIVRGIPAAGNIIKIYNDIKRWNESIFISPFPFVISTFDVPLLFTPFVPALDGSTSAAIDDFISTDPTVQIIKKFLLLSSFRRMILNCGRGTIHRTGSHSAHTRGKTFSRFIVNLKRVSVSRSCSEAIILLIFRHGVQTVTIENKKKKQENGKSSNRKQGEFRNRFLSPQKSIGSLNASFREFLHFSENVGSPFSLLRPHIARMCRNNKLYIIRINCVIKVHLLRVWALRFRWVYLLKVMKLTLEVSRVCSARLGSQTKLPHRVIILNKKQKHFQRKSNQSPVSLIWWRFFFIQFRFFSW